MTATTKSPRTTKNTPMSREAVVKMLRDAAFILRVTRQVRTEIEAERPEIARKAAVRTPELAAGLGV